MFIEAEGVRRRDQEALAEGQFTLEPRPRERKLTAHSPGVGCRAWEQVRGGVPTESDTQCIKYNKSCEANQIPCHPNPTLCQIVKADVLHTGNNSEVFLVIGKRCGGVGVGDLLREVEREGFWERSKY